MSESFNFLKRPIKDVKKAMYRSKARKFRNFVIYMLIGGILASVIYFVKSAYVGYAVSKVHIVLSYPEVAESQYPDGSRFTYYDFISNERLDEAIKVMQEKGKYKYMTVDSLRDKFYVYGYLEKSASSNVSSERSEGNDFSYVANEYEITYIQPHDYKNPNLIKKFLVPNDSKEFLETLVEVNRKYIAETKGGIEGFKVVTDLDDVKDCDYDERINVYKAKKNAIISYLGNLDAKAPKFKSQTTKMSIKDVKSKYELLISNKLDAISNYVDTTGISKDVEVASNKIKVNIEDSKLKYDKVLDESAITEYAMQNYDHTFTENLINVVRDDSQGLYQARPKTAFDTVVVRMNDAKEAVSEYNEDLFELNNDLQKFQNIDQSADKNAVMKKCDKLFDELDKEYNDFTTEATTTVEECLDEINQGFIAGTVKAQHMISLSFIIKLGITFCVGMVVMFLICVYFSVITDRIEVKRRKRLLKEIKNTSKGE